MCRHTLRGTYIFSTQPPDVIIIGGGPMGLANAWGIKRLNPDLHVVVYEKYEEYQRKHTLNMDYRQLTKLMQATHTQDDPILSALLTRLRDNPHIRTNELEGIFKQLATESDVETIITTVTSEMLREMLEQEHKPALVIGADGIRSVVNTTLFPMGNQVKRTFDHVLQLRYEVNGTEVATAINPVELYQQMAREGYIATEYVGNFAEGKTPITVQIVITKEDYEALQAATSKVPLYPYTQRPSRAPNDDPEIIDENEPHRLPLPPMLPRHLQTFIGNYIQEKIRIARSNGQTVDQASIRVSVNETPATHSHHVVQYIENTANTSRPIPIVLEGDATLSLSYFKGLNAGIEATAYFLSKLGPAIQAGLPTTDTIAALTDYEHWMAVYFAPKKVSEVASYSQWRVRTFMRYIEAARELKEGSGLNPHYDPTPNVIDALNLQQVQTMENLAQADRHIATYPHRAYDLVTLGQFKDVPLIHTLVKIKKLFADYVKPYKSEDQTIQDFKQPLVGINNLVVGILKMIASPFGLDFRYFIDGLLTTLRGVIEIATTPLAWTIKPIMRGIITRINGPVNIETNAGLQRVVQQAEALLAAHPPLPLAPTETYNLLAICNDLHRKLRKSAEREQPTTIDQMEEIAAYNAI